MSNVVFIPTTYLPSFEESKRLDGWQLCLSQWRAELAYLHKQKGFSPGEIAQSKRRFHEGVREHWKVLPGGLEIPLEEAQ